MVERVRAELGVGWTRGRRSSTTRRCMERYAEQIPVTFVDGRQHDYWRVDETRLRAALPPPSEGDREGPRDVAHAVA